MRQRNCGWAIGVALFAVCTMAQGGALVITSADIPAEVGMRITYAFVSEDGQREGTFTQTFTEKIAASGATVYRVAQAIGGSRLTDAYFTKSKWGWTFQNTASPDGPENKIPLPLQVGTTYTHRHGKTSIQGKVEGPVSVTVPAGAFQALLRVEQHEKDGETWTQKFWMAPKMGAVKMTIRADQMYTLSLVSVERASREPSEAGAAVLSNFDAGAPLGSPLFPGTPWQALPQDGKAMSTCEIDPVNAAAGTPMCLRWTHVYQDHWSNVGIVPSGQWGKPVDLSKYRSISFQARALKPGKYSLQFAVGPWANGNAVNKDIPLQLAPSWQRFKFDLRMAPQLEGIDWTKVYAIRFATFGEGGNVVWLDEIMLHAAGSL